MIYTLSKQLTHEDSSCCNHHLVYPPPLLLLNILDWGKLSPEKHRKTQENPAINAGKKWNLWGMIILLLEKIQKDSTRDENYWCRWRNVGLLAWGGGRKHGKKDSPGRRSTPVWTYFMNEARVVIKMSSWNEIINKYSFVTLLRHNTHHCASCFLQSSCGWWMSSFSILGFLPSFGMKIQFFSLSLSAAPNPRATHAENSSLEAWVKSDEDRWMRVFHFPHLKIPWKIAQGFSWECIWWGWEDWWEDIKGGAPCTEIDSTSSRISI